MVTSTATLDEMSDKAIALWEEARQQADPAEKIELAISLARAYARADRHHGAIAVLAGVIVETTRSEELSQAAGLLASSYEALGDWDAAIAAFERYLELEDWAAPYVRWHMAKAHEALDEDEEAEVERFRDFLEDVTPEDFDSIS